MNKKIILGSLFLFYFFFIIIYTLKRITDLSLERRTYINKAVSVKQLEKANYYLSKILLQKKNENFSTDCMGAYLAATGSNNPFAHFADVAPCYKLVFELDFNDGTKQFALPKVGSVEMSTRFNDFLNTIVTTSNDLFRNALIEQLAENELLNYSNVKKISVVIGVIDIPRLNDFASNPNFNFRYFYQYNFIPKQ